MKQQRGAYPKRRHLTLMSAQPGGLTSLPSDQGAFTQELVIYVSSGILEVHQGVTILSDIAIRDIADGKPEEKTRQAADAVKNYVSTMEYARLDVELGRSLAQIKDIERLLKSKNRF